MYIHNSWLHVRLLNRQSKREKRVEQEGRYSLCPAVRRSSVGTYIQKNEEHLCNAKKSTCPSMEV
jgi:hypothetical protein